MPLMEPLLSLQTTSMTKPRKLRALLVGEGNFSFTVSLLRKLKQADITATCSQEQNPYCIEQQGFMAQAVAIGARVLINVDARCLHLHPSLYADRFDRIIFNFPHVGGKMKICKNRKLLKDFFTSASHLLTPGGEICVTLCKGQGGTPADTQHRRQDDTWKVVEMAAYGGLVLTDVRPFDATEYPDYSSVGYRSGAKSFDIEGALTHTFKRNGFPVISEPGHRHDYMVEDIRSALVEDSHPLHMAAKRVENIINEEGGFGSVSILRATDWEMSQASDIKTNVRCCCTFRLNQSTSPRDPPFNHIVELRQVNDVRHLLTKAFDFEIHLADKCCRPACECIDSATHLLCGDLCVGTVTMADGCSVLSIKLEQVAMAQFNVDDWRRLLPSESVNSLYPQEYWLDSSFWISEKFSKTAFLRTARLAAGGSLLSLYLLETYRDGKSGRTSMCYRFCYKSLHHALTRDVAKSVHDTVRKTAEEQFGVELR